MQKILFLISTFASTGADYGVDNIQSYRLNTDLKRFPVQSPDQLFGFEVSPNVEQKMRPKTYQNNNNVNKNQNNNQIYNNNDYEEYLDQNNVLREPLPTKPLKKSQKNRLKTSYRKPIAAKPMKMIFSQYLSPQAIESEDSYPLNPSDTFDDQYLAQLMPQIMSTAEHMALKHEEEVRQYEHPVIPASDLLEYLRSSQHFFTLSESDDDPYGIKRSGNVWN